MANLILPSLEIQNFRVFEHLRIERLGRVNLITGKNNVGKTCFLEALYLYANYKSAGLVRDLLDKRDELLTNTNSTIKFIRPETGNIDFTNIRRLFHNRPTMQEIVSPITIGPITTGGGRMSLSIEWRELIQHQTLEGKIRYSWELPSPQDTTDNLSKSPFLVNLLDDQLGFREQLENVLLSSGRSPIENQFIYNEYIRSDGLDNVRIANLWDRITLSPLEEEVLAAMQMVAPEVSRVGIISQSDETREPVPIIVTREHQERLPLHSLGDGTTRLFGIALALVNVQNGMLLIDEVETGLHYSVMPDVWKLIFLVAERLNVQVFATTHSWDCIEAFQQAAAQDQNEEAVLIRLENRNGSVAATLFDERKLDIATRELIEVR